jgi:hypothetical protein
MAPIAKLSVEEMLAELTAWAKRDAHHFQNPVLRGELIARTEELLNDIRVNAEEEGQLTSAVELGTRITRELQKGASRWYTNTTNLLLAAVAIISVIGLIGWGVTVYELRTSHRIEAQIRYAMLTLDGAIHANAEANDRLQIGGQKISEALSRLAARDGTVATQLDYASAQASDLERVLASAIHVQEMAASRVSEAKQSVTEVRAKTRAAFEALVDYRALSGGGQESVTVPEPRKADTQTPPREITVAQANLSETRVALKATDSELGLATSQLKKLNRELTGAMNLFQIAGRTSVELQTALQKVAKDRQAATQAINQLKLQLSDALK